MKPTITIIDTSTNEIIEREMTEQEIQEAKFQIPEI